MFAQTFLHLCRKPLRRSQSFAHKEGTSLKFMSRGSQPNLVAYADNEADQASSTKDDTRKKAGGHMRNVSTPRCPVQARRHDRLWTSPWLGFC